MEKRHEQWHQRYVQQHYIKNSGLQNKALSKMSQKCIGWLENVPCKQHETMNNGLQKIYKAVWKMSHKSTATNHCEINFMPSHFSLKGTVVSRKKEK